MAPQAQNAHWKPLVSAAVGVAPWWSRVVAWVAAMVEATATPIAPPSCWEVLSSPEARPASCLAIPARAAMETGMKANAVPTPTIAHGPARLAQKVPCTVTWVAHRMPPPIMAMPAAMTSLAEPRVTSACDRPARATEVSDVASQRLQPEDPQWHQRRLQAGLDDHEGGEQDDGHREQRHRPGGAPADLRGSGDRVDEQRQATGHRDRAERVIAPARRGEPALRHEARGEQQRRASDRDIEEEDVLPAGVAGEQTAGHHPDGRTARPDGAPHAECLVALGA